MRKLTVRDWLVLVPPFGGSILAGYLQAEETDWRGGAITAGIALGFTVWIWRRQIIKYPEDTWKARL